MIIDSAAFEQRHQNLPTSWLCGFCRMSHIVELLDERKVFEWPSPKTARSCDAWEPDWIEEGFAAFFECRECHTGTVVSGRTVHRENYDEEFRSRVLERYFIPEQFTTAPATLIPPVGVPKDVEAKVTNIFGHIWSDPAACAGAIRICVEKILIDQGVRKTRLVKRKGSKPNEPKRRLRLSAHERISKHLPASLKEAKDHLLALKWVGNHGAHPSPQGHSRKELLEFCEHLQEVLIIAYSRDSRTELRRRAKSISSRKGKPIPGRKRRP